MDGHLTWEFGYERVPKGLERKYAYCEILGPKGPVKADTLILGFVLFAPGTTYPQHSHKDIEESYVSIAGAWSENDTAVYAPGSLILNRPSTSIGSLPESSSPAFWPTRGSAPANAWPPRE